MVKKVNEELMKDLEKKYEKVIIDFDGTQINLFNPFEQFLIIANFEEIIELMFYCNSLSKTTLNSFFMFSSEVLIRQKEKNIYILLEIYYFILMKKISSFNIFNKDIEIPDLNDLEKIKKILNLTE
jgi:hypothetical protein